jgi:hypothetical protein
MAAKRQKVDATLRLRLVDPQIDKEAALLDKLRSSARLSSLHGRARADLKKASPLYIRYRGKGFPLRTRANRIPGPWRSLSSWMKLQIAGLCLAEHTFQQFRITPTQDIIDRLESKELVKDYLRDDLRRRLRKQFDWEPWFFFAIEDRSSDGMPVAPHIHGSIRIQPLSLPVTANGAVRARWAKLVAAEGLRHAQDEYSREKLADVLKQIPGPNGSKHDWWSGKPIRPKSNPDYISYTLKNMMEFSPDLPERRMVISRSLTQEARKLWELIRRGEDALSQWHKNAP